MFGTYIGVCHARYEDNLHSVAGRAGSGSTYNHAASHAAECGCEIFGGRECSPVDKYSCRAVKDRAVGKGRQGVSRPLMYRLIHAPRRKSRNVGWRSPLAGLYGVGGEMAQDVVAVA